jgi:hypothetical protein
LTRSDDVFAITWRRGGCAIDGESAFVAALLGLENEGDLMSLELWGDSQAYKPYQRVLYFLRVPRAAYVTAFWIGPKQDVFVPFDNLKVPADRDVSVDPDSVVVPPLGREQWVGVATLEPVPFDCHGSEQAHLAWVAKVKALPHGVGRWEVRSGAGR